MEITLRPAILSDAEIVFEWRNAPETRQYFFDARPLNKADHIHWFEKSLTMQGRFLFIAELNHQPIGVLRYDVIDTTAEIDVYLKPGLSGKGLGTKILVAGTEWIKQHLSQIKILRAKVIADNIASSRAFTKAGFGIKIQVYEMNMETPQP